MLKSLRLIEWNSSLLYVRIDRLTSKQWKSVKVLKAMTLLLTFVSNKICYRFRENLL